MDRAKGGGPKPGLPYEGLCGRCACVGVSEREGGWVCVFGFVRAPLATETPFWKVSARANSGPEARLSLAAVVMPWLVACSAKTVTMALWEAWRVVGPWAACVLCRCDHLSPSASFGPGAQSVIDFTLGRTYDRGHAVKGRALETPETIKIEFSKSQYPLSWALAQRVANSLSQLGPELLRFLWAIADRPARNRGRVRVPRPVVLVRAAPAEQAAARPLRQCPYRRPDRCL